VTDSYPSLRRLRFDFEVAENESVPGAIARAIAENHLVRLNVVLREVGLSRYAGAAQLAPTSALGSIAHVLRCAPERLTAQAGRRLIEPGDRRLQHFIDFDGLVVPSSHLELKRRRIAPGGLQIANYHRQNWMLSVLPYCPETLERIIDECPGCGAALGWIQSAGIDRCEHCLEVVPPSELPALLPELADDYRLFASLLSMQPAERTNAILSMPTRLRDMSSGALARFAMRCGLDCSDEQGKRAWQTRAGRLPAEQLARTACRGIELLRSWPHGITAWAEEQIERSSEEDIGRRNLRRRIQRIAWGDSRFEDQRDLVQEAFPRFEPPRVGTAGGDQRFYTGKEADRILPGFRSAAVALRTLGIVEGLIVASHGIMESYIYPAAKIDAAAVCWADAMPVSTIAGRLRLPFYAVEQLIGARLLARHEDAVLAVLMRRPQAIASIFNEFVSRLDRRAARRTVPKSAVPIGQESRRIGGGPKPWSDIFQELLNGRIRFWLNGNVDVDHLLVERGSLDAFVALPLTANSPDHRSFVDEMSTSDAAELLNVIPSHVVRLASAGVLIRSTGLRAMTIPRIEVERLARERVSPAEIARRARTSPEHVNNRLKAEGFNNLHGLWQRSEAVDAVFQIR
jgi:hypothetical protein